MTINGPATVRKIEASRAGTSYQVDGDGFSGWYASHEVLGELDDDETTTSIPFSHEEPTDTTMVPDDNPHAEDGALLPWDPSPTAEWDGELTQAPDGDDISLKPTRSTEDGNFKEAPEDSNKVFGKFARYTALLDSDRLVREAAWKDVRAKASRMYREGDVKVQLNSGREIRARVTGDTSTYDTQVHRKNAFGDGVTYWDCDCAWGKHAYLRQRTFVGRMCSHALATYWAMQAKTLPENKNKRINDKTERHTLGAVIDEDPHSQAAESDYNPSENYPDGYSNHYNKGEMNEDPWQLAADPHPHVRTQSALTRNAEGYIEDEYVPYGKRRESKAAREGGLMIWDDKLDKVMDKFFGNGAGPAGAAGGPPDPSQMGSDTLGSPMSADTSPDLSQGVTDPSQGDPNGAGLPPAQATPPFVRSTPAGPTAPDPTGNAVTSSRDFYPTRRTALIHHAEFTDGNPDNDFEEWGEPNSEDAETFNTVQDLPEENDPEENVYDEFYGRSSSKEADLRFHGDMAGIIGDQPAPSVADPAPGTDINTPAVPETALPVVPRTPSAGGMQANATYGDGLVIRNDSNDPHGSPYLDAAEEELHAERPTQKYIPEVFRQNHQHQGSLDYLLAENDDEPKDSWEKDPEPVDKADDNDYDHDDENYENDDSDKDGKTSSLESWFMDDGNAFSNRREAERFNDDSDEITQEFQRSAAARQIFGGRAFSYGEQQDLIDENPDSRASQFGDLNLRNSFYEEV
jgi:hypothetical protein